MTEQTVLDRLIEAFPAQYVGESTTDYRFRFRRGAMIWVRKSNLNLARILYTSLSNFPNGDAVRNYVDNERSGVPIRQTQTKTECLFEPRHINRLIELLNS